MDAEVPGAGEVKVAGSVEGGDFGAEAGDSSTDICSEGAWPFDTMMERSPSTESCGKKKLEIRTLSEIHIFF